jgi:hypothetical protein
MSILCFSLKRFVDLPYPDHPMVSIDISTDARIAETEDGCYLNATALNRLPCVSSQESQNVLTFRSFLISCQMLPVDEVSVFLLGRDSERSKFISLTHGLPPGKTSLTMFCPV